MRVASDNLLISSTTARPEPGDYRGLGRLIGASTALAVAELCAVAGTPLFVLADDPRQADRLVS